MPAGYPSSSLAGGPAAAAAEAAHGERVNPTLRQNQAAFHGDGRYGAPANGPSNASVAALNEANAATRAASGMPGTPSTASPASKWFGSADDWKGAVGSQKGSLRMSPTTAPGMLGKGLLGVQGAVGAYNAYEGIQEGDALKTGLGAADVAATGALLTPAAPAAAAYLGARGAWESGKAAGGYLGSKLSDGAQDAIGGTINQIGLNTGLWGTDDSAYLRQKAANPAAPAQRASPQAAAPSARDPHAQANAAKTAEAGAAQPTYNEQRNSLRQDRPGQSPLFTNMPDGGMLGNDALMARGQPSARNLAAMESFAGSGGGLRGAQAAQYDREVANAQGINAMQQRIHGTPEGSIKNGLMTRTPDQQLRDAKVSAGSIHKRTAELGQAELKRLDNASSLRTKADAARYDTDSRSASERYKSDNSLRGDQARALGDRRGTNNSAAQKQQEMLMYGEAFRAAGGDPVRAAQNAAAMGIDPARFSAMSSADQSRGAANDKSTRGVFSGMFGKDGEQQEAQAHHQAQQMFPDWNRMSPDAQAQASTEVVQATKMLQSMNNQRNVGWGKKLGFDRPTPEMSQLPNMAGATLGGVGMFEGAVTPGVSRNDTKITLPGGGTRYLRAGELTEQQMRILENRGVKPAKD